MGNRYFRRRWDEGRGDQYDAWGGATYYFEVDEDGWPLRQVEVYDAGPVLRYGPGHEEDEFGQSGRAQLDELEDWSAWQSPRTPSNTRGAVARNAAIEHGCVRFQLTVRPRGAAS